MFHIDDIVRKVLVAIYKNEFLSKELYLKGGQALRVAQNLRERLSADSDFSVEGKIKEEDRFFGSLKESIKNELHSDGLYLIDFAFTRKPKIKSDGVPDFWQGWAVEFKMIERSGINLSPERQSASAIVPEGSPSSKITIDISEMEYCGGFEIIKVESVDVRVYSKPLLAMEKLRAICQSHPDYKLKSNNNSRARDFYDIEQIFSKVINEGSHEEFLEQCKEHLPKVFEAKQVPLYLIERILTDDEFLEVQMKGWEEVRATVGNLDQDFSFYLQNLKSMMSRLKKRDR